MNQAILRSTWQRSRLKSRSGINIRSWSWSISESDSWSMSRLESWTESESRSWIWSVLNEH